MKIAWIADNFYPDVQRGAEIEDNILIEEGIRRGHEIVKMGWNFSKLHTKVDLFIVANFIDTYNYGELLGYLSQRPYVNVEHDLRAPQYAFYKMFATDAIINVYHSPLQRQLIERFAGTFNHFLHPMCLPDTFTNKGLKRKPPTDVLFVGDYSWEKGYKELVEWLEENPDYTIYHYGGGFPKTHERMVEVGYVGQEAMPAVYNQFSTLIFLPHYPQACSRVIAEAYLCKVPNVITNGNDGFTSYGWTLDQYDEVREQLINGHKNFWNKLEKEGINV